MPKKDLRYKTLVQLKDAYDCGELHREHEPLWLDNDTCFAYQHYLHSPDDYEMDGEQVFEDGSPRDLLEEALTLLGIPWERV